MPKKIIKTKKSNDEKYECKICGKKSDQKSHHISHLQSESHKKARKIKELELKSMSKDDLLKNYLTTDIEKILVRLENSEFIDYEFKKRKRSKLSPIYKLSNEEIEANNEENLFKSEFQKYLNTTHNLLRGAAVTGDDAFDDILYFLMYCFLQKQDFDNSKYDFNNLSRYSGNINRIKKYITLLNIDNLLEDTDKNIIRPKDSKELCSINKIGIVLKNHPTTKRLIYKEDFIKCSNRKIIVQCIKDSMIFINDHYNNIIKYQDIVGIAYEYFANKYGGNGGTSKEMGQYFTERPLMAMTFQLIDKDDLVGLEINDQSTIGDEFCATFGYPLYLRQFLKNKHNITISDNNMYGVEFHERLSRMAVLNAMFSMDTYDNVVRGDSFITNVSSHLDISVHNVPFGQSMKFNNIKETYKTFKEDNSNLKIPELKDIIHSEANVDAILASQLALYKTEKMGLLIIKDGKETSSDSHKDYRKFFCENCHIKKILKIPSGAFSSTGTKTVCLYFVKKEGLKTEEIQFLELNQEGNKIEEICKVSIMDLKAKNYSWDPEAYILDETFENMKEKSNCEFVKLGESFNFLPKSKRNAKFGKDSGLYPFYKSSMVLNSYVDKCDFNEESLIMGDGGSPNINYGINFSTSDHCYVFRSNNESVKNRYIYYYILFNLNLFEKLYKGSGIGNISKKSIQELEIPKPSLEIQEKTVEILNDLSQQKKLLEELKLGIERRMKYYLEAQIKKNDTEMVKLGDMTNINIGSTPSTKNSNYWSEKKTNHIWLSVSELNNNLNPIIKSNKYLTDEAIKKCNPKLVLKGSILMSFKLSIGKLGIAGCDLFTNEAIVHIKTNNKISDKWLYYFYLCFPPKGASGAIGQGSLNKEKLKTLDLLIIKNSDMEEEIVKYLDNLENKKNELEKEVDDIDILMKEILEQSYQ